MELRQLLASAFLALAFTTACAGARAGKSLLQTMPTYLARWPTKDGPPLDPNVPGSLQTWWSPFGPGGYVFNNVTTITKPNSFTFNAHPFRVTFQPDISPLGTFDHVKFLSISPQPFPVPASGQVLSYDVTIAAMTYPGVIPEIYKPFISQPDNDPRTGACAANLIDFNTNIVADFIITSKTVYALYERLTFARTVENIYKAFTYFKPVRTRETPNKRIDLSIRYNPAANSLTWLVEGQVVMTVDKIGFPPSDPAAIAAIDQGGVPEIVVPTSFNTGFACFTLLDGIDINTPSNTATGLLQLNGNTPDAYVVPSAFVVNPFANASARTDESLRSFGSGATLTVSNYSVAYL